MPSHPRFAGSTQCRRLGSRLNLDVARGHYLAAWSSFSHLEGASAPSLRLPPASPERPSTTQSLEAGALLGQHFRIPRIGMKILYRDDVYRTQQLPSSLFFRAHSRRIRYLHKPST